MDARIATAGNGTPPDSAVSKDAAHVLLSLSSDATGSGDARPDAIAGALKLPAVGVGTGTRITRGNALEPVDSASSDGPGDGQGDRDVDETLRERRARNRLAAQRSRARRQRKTVELQSTMTQLRFEVRALRSQVAALEYRVARCDAEHGGFPA